MSKEERTQAIYRTLLHYQQMGSSGVGAATVGDATLICKVLADLMHHCDMYGVDFDYVLLLARDDYRREQNK